MRILYTVIHGRLTSRKLLIALAILLGSAPSLTRAQQGWYPIEAPFAISDFDALNDSVIAAYYLSGATEVSFDGGKTWVVHDSAIVKGRAAFSSYQLRIITPNDLEILGATDRSRNGNVFFSYYAGHSNDSGKTWQSQTGSPDSYGFGIVRHQVGRWFYRALLPLQPNLAPMVWNGETGKMIWSNYQVNAPEIDMIDSIGIAAAFYSYTTPSLWRTANGGVTWDSIPNIGHLDPNAFGPVQAVSPGVWCVSDDNSLFRSVDSGKSWAIIRRFELRITDVSFFDSVGYIVLAGADYIEKSTDAGATWFAQSTGIAMSSVIPTGTNSAYLNNNSSTIMHLADGGVRGPVMSLPRLVDFGNIRPEIAKSISVLARNVGTDTLRVNGYNSDNNVIIGIVPDTFTIAPNDTLRLLLYCKVIPLSTDTAHVNFRTNSIPASQGIVVLVASNDSVDDVQPKPSCDHALSLRLTENPWTSASSLLLESTVNEQVRIRVCDLLGRVWYDKFGNSSAVTFVGADFPRGFYTIEVQRESFAPTILTMIHR